MTMPPTCPTCGSINLKRTSRSLFTCQCGEFVLYADAFVDDDGDRVRRAVHAAREWRVQQILHAIFGACVVAGTASVISTASWWIAPGVLFFGFCVWLAFPADVFAEILSERIETFRRRGQP